MQRKGAACIDTLCYCYYIYIITIIIVIKRFSCVVYVFCLQCAKGFYCPSYLKSNLSPSAPPHTVWPLAPHTTAARMDYVQLLHVLCNLLRFVGLVVASCFSFFAFIALLHILLLFFQRMNVVAMVFIVPWGHHFPC